MTGTRGTGVRGVGLQIELGVVVVNALGCSSDVMFVTFESTLDGAWLSGVTGIAANLRRMGSRLTR